VVNGLPKKEKEKLTFHDVGRGKASQKIILKER